MIVIGIDLSGPSNTADTCLVSFASNANRLQLFKHIDGASDEIIYQTISDLPEKEEICIGLDAPLSYAPGGGDRPSDNELRRRLTPLGMPSGCVMPPTLNKMAYLTLRGLSVARLLEAAGKPNLRIVEVHPGAAMALGGAQIAEVRTFKEQMESRLRLLAWMEGQGLKGVDQEKKPPDHYVAACACALAAWKWFQGRSTWLRKATIPMHPYDFAA